MSWKYEIIPIWHKLNLENWNQIILRAVHAKRNTLNFNTDMKQRQTNGSVNGWQQHYTDILAHKNNLPSKRRENKYTLDT